MDQVLHVRSTEKYARVCVVSHSPPQTEALATRLAVSDSLLLLTMDKFQRRVQLNGTVGIPDAKRVAGLQQKEPQKHTTGGIPRWSPTLVLVARFSAYVWQSGRDAQFSLTYGRMCYLLRVWILYYIIYLSCLGRHNEQPKQRRN